MRGPWNEANMAFRIIMYTSLVPQAMLLIVAVYLSSSLKPLLFIENYKSILIGFIGAAVVWTCLTVREWLSRWKQLKRRR
ncbi:hypothetical protein GGQ80_003645 [Sphingomonas jinjuensis]|uniref:Uncharacterized protein n=1 Tax=Sphingomonas jinjuensis TaxID=535907 RepID=A0A840FCG5_9SPHN|nr:hypothetical protein [Sphingomonas jinjuensis]